MVIFSASIVVEERGKKKLCLAEKESRLQYHDNKALDHSVSSEARIALKNFLAFARKERIV